MELWVCVGLGKIGVGETPFDAALNLCDLLGRSFFDDFQIECWRL